MHHFSRKASFATKSHRLCSNTMSRNIKLLIAFDGTEFNGWQRQKHDSTIQGEIEQRLALMAGSEVILHGAGRTDAGVHAEGMVANFSTGSSISCTAFLKGLNSMLPYAIRILDVIEMPADFHARFSAKGKLYQYTIQTSGVQPPNDRLYALHVPSQLDFHNISACLDVLIGTNDFSSFENSGSRDKSNIFGRGAIRTISEARLTTLEQQKHVFTFIGDGFLRHMVRNLVGTLLEVGKGKYSIENFQQILLAKSREAAGPTAPPHGLTLKEVFY